MARRSPSSNTNTVLAAEARKEVRRRDIALREHVGPNPTELAVVEAFPQFFPDSHLTPKQVRGYARSVVAGRPHFV